MQEHNRKIEFIQEVYESYIDVKNSNLTLTRLYIILILSLIFSFGFLSAVMLFFQEFFMSFLYMINSIFFFFLLLNRNKTFIAKNLDYVSYITASISILMTLTCDMYTYGYASGGQLYILVLISLLFIIHINKSKKRLFISIALFIFFLLYYVGLILIDYFIWHKGVKFENFPEVLFIISICMCVYSSVMVAKIVGLNSVSDIEKLTFNKKSINFKDLSSSTRILDKKDFTLLITQNQNPIYKQLNVCNFELTLKQKHDDLIFKIDSYFYNKIIKEFISLIRAYYPDEDLFIKWDINNFILIVESDVAKFNFLLESINKDFNLMIKNQQNRYYISLKMIAKYYKIIDTTRKPKILLEKINEVIKLKYESRDIAREFLIYQCDEEHDILEGIQ